MGLKKWILCGTLLLGAAAFGNGRPVKVALFPVREALIVSEIDGMLNEYAFRIGERFRKGDLIVSIQDIRYRIDVDQAAAKLEEISVQTKFAEEQYLAQKKLFEEDFQSKLELERRKSEYETLAAREKITRAECEEARLLLSFCSKKAPFDGRLEEILCRTYETVRAGQPLFRIIDDKQLLAVMNIPLSELRPLGETLHLTFEDGKYSADGRIYEIAPRADHRSGTILVKVLIPNDGGKLTAGMIGVWCPPRKGGPDHGKR